MNFSSSSLRNTLSIYSANEIAKYIRLSLADEYGQKDESESVANQRRLLNEFISRISHTEPGNTKGFARYNPLFLRDPE